METPNLVKGWTSTYQVKAEEIIVVVLSRKFADIYLESGKTIETRHLLHEIQEKWPDCLMFVHRSYVINPCHVVEWNKSSHKLVLRNGMVIPLARRRSNEFQKCWERLVNEQLMNPVKGLE